MHISFFSHWLHMWHEIDEISTYSFRVFLLLFLHQIKSKQWTSLRMQQRNLCLTLKKQNKPQYFLSLPSKEKPSQFRSKKLQNKAGFAFVFTVCSFSCDFTDATSPLKYIQIYFPSQLLWKLLPPSRKPDRAKKKRKTSVSQNVVETQKQVKEQIVKEKCSL